MSFMADFQNQLVTDSGVSASTSRIYDNRAPQSPTMPYVVITEISATRFPTTKFAGGIVQKRVQVDCYASNTTAMRTLAEYVREALDGFSGTMGTTVVRSCHLDGETEQYEPPTDGSSGGKCRKIQEYVVFHTETIPTF